MKLVMAVPRKDEQEYLYKSANLGAEVKLKFYAQDHVFIEVDGDMYLHSAISILFPEIKAAA